MSAVNPGALAASTTQAVAADVASRGEPGQDAFEPRHGLYPGEGVHYTVGAGVTRAMAASYQRKKGDPLYRPLRIFTQDPAASRLDGAIATINVPFEPLRPGPVGALFEVDHRDGETGAAYGRADLDDRNVLIADGYDPSQSNPRFHQQMVYAVCANLYSAFKTALGRNLSWGFGAPGAQGRLLLRPHCGREANAYYAVEHGRGELRFGYFPASDCPTDRTLPGGFVFTCLSHDIVVHEATHALLDGLRAHFTLPSNGDVAAFHEAFADLMAVFQHFSYPEVVLAAVKRCRGSLRETNLLTQLARQFGHTTGGGGPLRTAIEPPGAPLRRYDPALEPHALGQVLLNAVFDAFATVFQRKTERYLRLASNGTGVLPPGDLPLELQGLLAERASKLASQFQAMCIRAIDYCPPVGMTFGDYLRALVTADADVVPDDRWDYRGTLIDAFWRRGIYPRSASSLSEEALQWKPPRMALPPVPGLDFGTLRFDGDPGRAAGEAELRRQACRLGWFMTRPQHLREFGLVGADDPALDGDVVEAPCVQSIRSARRAGPDGQIVFDLVAEVTQLRHVRASADGPAFSYHGGATVILDPSGEVRLVVLKSVTGEGRLQRRRAFLADEPGQGLEPAQLFRRLHALRFGAATAPADAAADAAAHPDGGAAR